MEYPNIQTLKGFTLPEEYEQFFEETTEKLRKIQEKESKLFRLI